MDIERVDPATSDTGFTWRNALRRWSIQIQAVGIIVVMVVLRRNIIRQPWSHNPDEGELLVAAKRAAQSILPWDRFTTTSYGPLWPMTLAVARHLGLPLALPAAHLVATLLMGISCVGVLVVMRKLVGARQAFVLTAIIALVWASGGFPAHPDYLTLATELGPLALVSVAMMVIARDRFDERLVLVALLLVGSAPLFKYQFGFVALSAALVLIHDARLRGGESGIRRVIVHLAVLGTPVLVVLTLALVTGRAHFLVDEALASVSDQINMGRLPFDVRSKSTSAFLITQMFFNLPAVAAAVALLSHRVDHRRARRDALFLGAVFCVTIPSVIGLSYRFIHYSYIVLCTSVVVAGLAVSLSRAHRVDQSASNHLRALLIGLAVVLAVPYVASGVHPALGRSATLTWGDVFSGQRSGTVSERGATDEVARVCPGGSKVYVWGWAGELYSYYDWDPVSRYTISTWITNGTARSPLYAERLVGELAAERPDCIVDAVGRGFHGNYTKKNSLANEVPRIAPLLAKDYREKVLSATSLRRPLKVRVYVRVSD